MACVILVMSGCYGNNNPSGTERDKVITSASETEEVTSVPEETTTTPVETTVTTTVAEPKPALQLTAPTGEITKTFGVEYEYRNNEDAGETVRSPFDDYYVAYNEVYVPICSAPNETFMTTLRANEEHADLAELFEPYADGDVLVDFMIVRYLESTDLCHIFDDTPTGKCYRLDDFHVVYLSEPAVVLLEKRDMWTDVRRAVELLWANYDVLQPISLIAVYDVELASKQEQAQHNSWVCPYWLKISASAETLDAIKKAFDENGIEKSKFEFVEIG